MAHAQAPVAMPSIHALWLRSGPGLMTDLVLYSRQGCCLCEGLESRLRSLDLSRLEIALNVVDIDASGSPAALRARYDLAVPVLVVGGRELPRVSPRLTGEALLRWLERSLVNDGPR